MRQVIEFIQGACPPGRRPVLVAHNGVRYDFMLLFAECLRAGVELPPDWLFIDTLPLAKVSEWTRGLA